MNISPFLQPSGLNSQFHGGNLAFDTYIQLTQQMIAAARIDLTPANAQQIIAANSPYSWLPETDKTEGKYPYGILFIHGLYDSPFMLKDLAHDFLQQGFLVNSILLPGHGTVPGDLLTLPYGEWVKAVDYGVAQLKNQAEQVVIVGFSLGGLLAVHKALLDPSIAALILIAPALALRFQQIARFAYLSRLLSWALPACRWYARQDQTDYTKYQSFPFNSAYQIYQLIRETQALLRTQRLAMPIFGGGQYG